MTIVSILVDGKAVGQGSFRPGRKLYQSPQLAAYREAIAWRYLEAADWPASASRAPAGIPVGVYIAHHRCRPLDHWKRDGTLTKKGDRTPIPTTKHLDVDKLARAILDALTGVAYTDDSQVSRLFVGREWAASKGSRESVSIVVSWEAA